MFRCVKGYSVDYLTGPVAGGRESYYTGAVAAGEPPGVWYGAGAAELGLTGEVDSDLMEAVYARRLDPRDAATHDRQRWAQAERFGPPRRNYQPPEEIYQAALAAEPGAGPERRAQLQAGAERESRQNVAFWDATFSAPKSVTVLAVAFERAANNAAGAGRHDEAASWTRMQQAVEGAVMAGASASVDYLQDAAGYARVGDHAGGAGRWMDSHRFVVAQFLQHDSRDKDPQLHVHQAILNALQRADGGWGTLDGRALTLHQRAAGAVGERVMEAELTRVLGVRFATRPDGMAREVVGVAGELMEMFSKRTRAVTTRTKQVIAEYEARHGRPVSMHERHHIVRQAALLTRKAKSHDGETAQQRLDRWERESRTRLAGGLSSVAREVVARDAAGPPEQWSPQQVIHAALTEVGENVSSWTRADLVWAVSNALPGHLDIPADEVRPLLERLTDKALAEAVVVVDVEDTHGLPVEFRLANGLSPYQRPGSGRYATTQQVAAERVWQRAAVRTGAASLTPEQADAVLARLADADVVLGPDQAAAVRGVLTSSAAVETLTAAAGTGKSFTVGAIAQAWAEHGRRTFGLAASQNAADVMSDEGVTAFNIERWRGELERDQTLALRAGDLVVVDEAGMASTQDVADIVGRCEAAGAKLLLVGDSRQLSAVGPGGAFADIGATAARYELTEVRRFDAEWEGSASLRLRDGDVDALDDYDKHGRLRSAGTVEQAEQAAGRAWLADTLAGKQSLLLVGSNEQAARVSAQLRAELVRLGRVCEHGVELGRDATTAGVGDMVQARRNHWSLRHPVINRQTYRVTDVLDDGRMRVETGKGREILLPARYVAEHLSLAYASTVYAAQGRTVDTAHGVAGAGTDAGAGYVMATRGRECNTLWVPTQPLASDAPVGEAQQVVARTAKAVLADTLRAAEQQQEQGAVAEQEQAVEDDRSEFRVVDRLLDGISVAGAGRTSRALDRLAAAGVITGGQRQELAADQAMWSVEQLLRHAEVGGHNPDELLRGALERKSLAGARSVGQVLHSRIRTAVGQAAPRISSFRDLIPGAVPQRWRPHLERLADRADVRRGELGARVAEQAPGWAVEALGPVPDDEQQRHRWASRVGWAAAHRENAEHDDEKDPLGASPPAGLPEKHAVWATAHTALDLPDVSAEEAQLSDGRLLVRAAAYEREKTWAPRYVADELAETSSRVAARRTDAELSKAHADTVSDEQEKAGVQAAAAAAETEADEMERTVLDLEEADRARTSWFLHTAGTRDAAARAKAELGRRGVDLVNPPDRTTAAEWLAAERAAEQVEDEHRPVGEGDLADEQLAAGQDDEPRVVEQGYAPEPAREPETAVADVRDVAVADPTEDDPRIRRQVPGPDDTAAAVRRAREALLEMQAREEYDRAHEDDEVADRAARWSAGPDDHKSAEDDAMVQEMA